jgi:hypothetical protein
MPKFTFNPFTSNFDVYENNFGTTGIYLIDSDGVSWQLQVDTAGVLYTTVVGSGGVDGVYLAENGDYLLTEAGDYLATE